MEERTEVMENLEIMAEAEATDETVEASSNPTALIMAGAALAVGLIAGGKFVVGKIRKYREKKAGQFEVVDGGCNDEEAGSDVLDDEKETK